MLTDGDYLDVIRRIRGELLARHRDTRPEWSPNRDLGFERVRRCISEAHPIRTCCRRCGRFRVVLLGKCGRRDCLICCHRPARRSARKFLEDLGQTPWIGHYVVTLGEKTGARCTPQTSKDLLRPVSLAMERVFHPVLPAGLAVVHWTGEKDPSKPHVHVHLLWGALGMAPTGVAEIPGPTISAALRQDLREATGEAVQEAAGHRQGKYLWRSGPGAIEHCVRYALRPQGCGNDRAMVRWTVPRAHTSRPFGCLASQRRAAWVAVRPILEDRHGGGEGWVGYQCPCGCQAVARVV